MNQGFFSLNQNSPPVYRPNTKTQFVDESEFVPIRFQVSCPQADLKKGYLIKIVGSSPQFGSWQAPQGLAMFSSEAEAPVWRTSTMIDLSMLEDPHKETLEYRYVVVHKDR